MSRDSVFSARAIFIDDGGLAAEIARGRDDLAYLRRLYRIVAIKERSMGGPRTSGSFDDAIELRELPAFCRRRRIETYASWHVHREGTAAPASLLVARGLSAVRRAEEASRIIVDGVRLARLIASLRARGRRIVFTNGVFDLTHVGHLRLLEKARLLGDVLVMGINSDDSTRRIKGASRPVVQQFARAEALTGLRCVDYCCIFTENDPRRILAVIRPDVLAKGCDYSLRGVVGGRFVASYGGRVERLPLVLGCSTTSTIARIRHRNGEGRLGGGSRR